MHRAPWDDERVLKCVTELEGHCDNGAAALYGGLVICAPGAPVARIDTPDELSAVVFVPAMELPTAEARRVVPGTYSRADAVFNAARVALLVRSFALRDYGLLGTAMEDRWHQPQRAALIPWMPDVIAAARRAGALGAALSGAGPSILALTLHDEAAVGAAMAEAASHLGVAGEARQLRLRNFGARVDVKA